MNFNKNRDENQFKMKIGLCMMYWSLLFTSLISSCLLFLIVASETTKIGELNNLNEKGALSTAPNENDENGEVNAIENDSGRNGEENQFRDDDRDEFYKNNRNLNLREESDLAVNRAGSEEDGGGDGDSGGASGSNDRVDYDNNYTSERDSDKNKENVPKSDIQMNKNDKTGDTKDESIVDNETDESLSDIPATPAVITLSEKTPELIIDSIDENSEDDIIQSSDIVTNKTEDDDNGDHNDDNTNNNNNRRSHNSERKVHKDDFIILSDPKNIKQETVLPHEIPPDERSRKIDDSGGGGITIPASSPTTIPPEGIIDIKDNLSSAEKETTGGGGIASLPSSSSTTATIPSSTTTIPTTSGSTITGTTDVVNITVEDNLIPVFSEWAQKQMEEAEKKLEKESVNSSSMRKNATAGNKPQTLKLRAKNYASPDCGAKIIASNAEAQNTGALLTSSKDEYMLSPCTNRIWFVVELCEAIQAEKIDLANFELFSSSPKNFSVAVNNRFPTREWSNVGRFVADDQRNIQSFELYPHLFGKFVRVDIHSHYNSEHFCPISLFRVYGTSEFEAFETENRPISDQDIDEFDDDETDPNSQSNVKSENNLFKSASDAVISIVKKAAEVLVKTNANKTAEESGVDGNNRTTTTTTTNSNNVANTCFTPKCEFTCSTCSKSMVARVNYLLSCKYYELISLLSIELLKSHIMSSQICANKFNFVSASFDTLACKHHNDFNNKPRTSSSSISSNLVLDEKQSYVLHLLPLDYIAALCHIINTTSTRIGGKKVPYKSDSADTALNLTIDRKSGDNFINVAGSNKKAGKKISSKLKIPSENAGAAAGGDGASIPNLSKIKDNKDFGKPSSEHVNKFEIENSSENLINPTVDEDNNEPTQIPQPPTEKDLKSDESLEEAIGSGSEGSDSGGNVDSNVNIFNIVENLGVESNEKEKHASNEQQQLPDLSSTIEERTGKIDEESLSVESVTAKIEDVVKIKDTTTEAETTGTWESIDNLLSDQSSSENLNHGNSESGGSTNYAIPQRVHSESVFLRLSNRIKALERNMSLSGQYLEELSRRYKKQVEELQHSFAKTLSAIEEQNRQSQEKEQNLIEDNMKLRRNLEELTIKVNTWIGLVVCVGAVVVLQIIMSWLFLRAARRQHYSILRKYEESCLVRNRRTGNSRKFIRRKSVEGVSGHPSPCHKSRRPSEEAMKITGSYKDLLIPEDGVANELHSGGGGSGDIDNINDAIKKRAKQRQRKISIIYNGGKQQPNFIFTRQESAPGDFNVSTVSNTLSTTSPDDSSLIPDEDYENYVPGSDLAYNEFMPEGPSGYMGGKVLNGDPINLPKPIKQKTSKIRRLSSPNFLKSTFGKSSANTNSNGSKKLPHGPTGWEWYRSKKTTDSKSGTSSHNQNGGDSSSSNNNNQNAKKKKSVSPKVSIKVNGIGANSVPVLPAEIATGTGTTTESEIVLNNSNCSDESLRTSGTSTTTGSLLSNGKSNSKKHRSFKKILKKVF